jgi:hypothetical protein
VRLCARWRTSVADELLEANKSKKISISIGGSESIARIDR